MSYSGNRLDRTILILAALLFILLLFPEIAFSKKITLSGRLYYGPTNNQVPIRYARVEVWDDWGLTPIASTQTDSQGRFTIKYENTAIGDGLDNRIDPKLKVICDNEALHLQGPGVINVLIIPNPLNLIPGLTDWGFTTDVIEMGLDKDKTNLVYVAPNDRWPAFASFSAMSDVYYKMKSELGTPPIKNKITAVWPAAVTLLNDLKHMVFQGTNQGASATLGTVFLSLEGASYPHEAQHEFAHAIMQYVYGTEWINMVSGPSGLPRDKEDFIEGWAEFLTRWARDEDLSVNTIGSTHCENGGSFNTTLVLWDLVDSSKSKDESPDYDDDPISDSGNYATFKKIWTIITQDKPHTLAEFWNSWINRYPSLEWEAKCCLVNNMVSIVTNNQPRISEIRINDKIPQEGENFSGTLKISATVEEQDTKDIPHLKVYFFLKRSDENTWYCLGKDTSISGGKATFTWNTTKPWTSVYPYVFGSGDYGEQKKYSSPSTFNPKDGKISIGVLVTDGMPWGLMEISAKTPEININNITSSTGGTVSPQLEPLVFNLPRQFSSTQGSNSWYYYFGSPPELYQAVFDNMVSPWGTLNTYSWNGGSGYSGPPYLQITGRDLSNWKNPGPCGWLIPGEGADVVLGWKAVKSGTVYISAMINTARDDATASSFSDDGVWFSIWKGTQRITNEARIFRGNDESNRIPYIIQKTSINVSTGDMIYFYIRRGNWQDCDEMFYSFTISYDPNADLDHPISNYSINGDTVTLSATDNSGEASIEYALHDEDTDSWLPWVKYETPFTLTSNIDRFMYRAIDNTGNLEPYHTVLIER